jgi:2-polyprenyl-6-hydroxyphenyl methylase/3-demethylubiquinone-9 3-methyltransferase
MKDSLTSRAMELYADVSVGDRLHMEIRRRLCPFELVAGYLPPAGLTVDLGCGHGLFSTLLALQSPERTVLGVELVTHKLQVGTQAAAHLPNLTLVRGSALAIPAQHCQSISVLDVAYLMPLKVQMALLSHCYERLTPDGIFLLKDIDTAPRWKFALSYAEEWLVGKLLSRVAKEQFNAQRVRSFHFHSAAHWLRALSQAGFVGVQAVRLDRGYPHPHLLLIGRKHEQ